MDTAIGWRRRHVMRTVTPSRQTEHANSAGELISPPAARLAAPEAVRTKAAAASPYRRHQLQVRSTSSDMTGCQRQQDHGL